VAGPWNNVFTTTGVNDPDVNLVDVRSDSATTYAFASSFTDGVAGIAGTDVNGANINLTFHDVGDGPSTVPDSVSTGLLALLSLISVFGMAKFRMAKAV
jgi:hypothetical protein